MARDRTGLIAAGVDPRVASRNTFTMAKLDGKYCRDRQPWGGFTDPDRCDCVGRCKYDDTRSKT